MVPFAYLLDNQNVTASVTTSSQEIYVVQISLFAAGCQIGTYMHQFKQNEKVDVMLNIPCELSLAQKKIKKTVQIQLII